MTAVPINQIICGDNVDTLRTLPDACVDSCVTDPPYGIEFMGKAWDKGVPGVELWREVLRVLKPGGHLLAFAGTRTQHRMATAIEDAGFEIRDMIAWVYGSGFPKSLDVSKAIDAQDAVQEQQARRYKFTAWVRSTGVTSKQIDEATKTNMGGHYTTAASQPAIMTREHLEACRHLLGEVPEWVERECDIRSIESQTLKNREVVGQRLMNDTTKARAGFTGAAHSPDYDGSKRVVDITTPATEAAQQWAGWGTALKPSWESVTWATKPLTQTGERNTIVWNLLRLESRLWLLQNASAVKLNSQSNQSEFAEVLNTAQWTAGDCINTQAVLCDQMGTSQYVSAVTSSLSIVSSWKNTLEESWSDGNTSITETESRQIIDWKTLRCSLSQITAESIVRACSLTGGFSANAGTAERYFSDSVVLLQSIRRLSAIEPAMLQAQALLQDEAVRPSLEPVMVARKPLVGTVADNVLQHGTGALNVDGCRVEHITVTGGNLALNSHLRSHINGGNGGNIITHEENRRVVQPHHAGRWPANLIHDGSDEVVGLFPEDGDASAARFFYCAKAGPEERRNSRHPTIKPVALMRYLVRLVTPPNGLVLDPFGGSGTTAEAARLEHCRFLLMELSPEYCADAAERLRQGVLF